MHLSHRDLPTSPKILGEREQVCPLNLQFSPPPVLSRGLRCMGEGPGEGAADACDPQLIPRSPLDYRRGARPARPRLPRGDHIAHRRPAQRRVAVVVEGIEQREAAPGTTPPRHPRGPRPAPAGRG
jgi:hypothetical protein